MKVKKKLLAFLIWGLAFQLIQTLPFSFAAPEKPEKGKAEKTVEKSESSKATSAKVEPRVLDSGPIVIIDVHGPINPATDDYLRGALKKAQEKNARLFVLRINTPGGVLTSTQTMVETLLEAKVPTVVYVTPSGAGAISAGTFITLAGHFAAMTPGTNIGAAHPVSGQGEDVQGDMGEKVENFAASLIKAIAEKRGRNVTWAEKAVRESLAITDREALDKKVIDVVASDITKLLTELEGRTTVLGGDDLVLLRGLADAPQETIAMTFKQKVVNFLSDPNIAILLGLAAMLGLGIEFYHPGGIFPGVFGAICLVLALTASQVLPINTGGALLLLLSVVFFVVELFMPSFGIWGAAGILCLVLGSIYFIDEDMVWSASGFEVEPGLIGFVGLVVGATIFLISWLALKAHKNRVMTGQEGLLDEIAEVFIDFTPEAGGGMRGKVRLKGEIWAARAISGAKFNKGDHVRVVRVEPGMVVQVKEVSK